MNRRHGVKIHLTTAQEVLFGAIRKGSGRSASESSVRHIARPGELYNIGRDYSNSLVVERCRSGKQAGKAHEQANEERYCCELNTFKNVKS